MTDRHTIGFIIPNIFYSNENRIWAALPQAARARNINLVSIVGARLNPRDISCVNANAIYKLIKPQQIDGILIWSSLTRWDITLDEFRAFVAGLGVPVVSADDVLPGVPSVVTDNYGGVCMVMEHMIKVHGRRRIAFLRGPENSTLAELRFRAYKDNLVAHRIDLDPALITPAAEWMDT
jgi:DNA-binding LacI/PurR family transcriptional regulator